RAERALARWLTPSSSSASCWRPWFSASTGRQLQPLSGRAEQLAPLPLLGRGLRPRPSPFSRRLGSCCGLGATRLQLVLVPLHELDRRVEGEGEDDSAVEGVGTLACWPDLDDG